MVSSCFSPAFALVTEIDSLLVLNSTINGLASDTITSFALALLQAPPRLCW